MLPKTAESFWHNGFAVLPRLICPRTAELVASRFEGLFRGQFETGVYPDEWHWREGLSYPDRAREIVNGWKCDHTVARLALSPHIGRVVAQLMGWERCGVRLGQDSVVWKVPRGGEVGFHTDGAYISAQFEPREENSVTVWVALDDADEETGIVRYARGSHRWAQDDFAAVSSSFHDQASDSVKEFTSRFSRPNQPVTLDYPVIARGGCALHHQDTWHGSGPNRSHTRHRRAVALHFLRGDVRFVARPQYIYGRYKRLASTDVDETFFPVVYRGDGYVTYPRVAQDAFDVVAQ